MRIWDNDQKRNRFEHVLIWETAHGPVPDGYEVHHINEDKLDNRLENLELITRLDHKRTHSPWYRRNVDGAWERQCPHCMSWKLATPEHWYFTKQGWMAACPCKPCHIEAVKARRAKHPAKHSFKSKATGKRRRR